MDKLKIDFNSLLPYVIDAFTSVYGNEYRSIISKKINNAFIVLYHDTVGLSDYISYIRRCKSREFSIRFLDEIGIDVQKHKKNNYTEPLDNDVSEILDCLIDSDYGFSEYTDNWVPFRAFYKNNFIYSEELLRNKLKVINYLLGNESEKITEENFDAFSKTMKYSELLKKINEFNTVYEKLLIEYSDWATQLAPYEKYVEDEQKRKTDILQKKKNEIFREIFDQLPSFVKGSVSNKPLEEQQDAILGKLEISSKFTIETFQSEQMEKLKSSDISPDEKYWIVSFQSKYLKSLGITISDINMLKCESEKDVANYLEFLNQDDIKKYIPSDELIKYISSLRERKYEEALREYYTTRKDFIDNINALDNNPNNIEFIYDQFKNKRVCIAGHGATKNNNEFISIMFYTIRIRDGGFLFHNFMHENGHIIDQSKEGIGFESFDDFNENCRKNPYDKAFRKYERFNETLNDIFTREAVKFLQDKGIYLLEPKELTSLDTSNCNTSVITKNLLQPLLQKFRQQVIKAKVNATPEELIKYIGEDNFEELVDAVNKVDYLSRNGVVPKIDKSPEDDMVIEYFEQLERVKQIYINIDKYYSDNFETLSENKYEEAMKKR